MKIINTFLFISCLLVASSATATTFSVSTIASQTFTVTNTDDNGTGSFRQALIDANATVDADNIVFAVSGTVTLLTDLPEITRGINIDGTTAPGYTATTPTFHIDYADNNNNTILKTNSTINADVTIRGLDLSSSTIGQSGIGIHIRGLGTHTVQNCKIQNKRVGIIAQGGATFIVEDNDLRETGANHNFFALGLAGLSGNITASGNKFGGANGKYGVGIENSSNLIIGNTNTPNVNIIIEDDSGINTAIGECIRMKGNCSNITIDGIDLSGIGLGIGVHIPVISGFRPNNITIKNVLIDKRHTGILINADGSNNITCSTFTNLSYGIGISGNTNVNINNNTLGCIGQHAVDNNNGFGNVNAENNYWEDPSGPSNDGGAGVSYNGTVDATPFLSTTSTCAPHADDLCPDLIPPPSSVINLQLQNPMIVNEIANSANALTFQFSRSGGDNTISETVNFSIHGTNLSKDDITVTSTGIVSFDENDLTGNITFPASESTVNLIITPKADNTVELTEEVGVKIEPF